MCACMINDAKFNNLIATDTKITFQKVILKKCYDVFYTKYQQELNKLKETMKNDNMVIVMLSFYFVMTYDYYHLWFLTYYNTLIRFFPNSCRKLYVILNSK